MEDIAKLRKLSARRRKFAEVYTHDGLAAAKAAGFKGTDEALKVTAYRVLNDPRVIEIIRAREKTEVRDHVMNRIQRQEFWTKVANDETLPIQHRLAASKLLGDSEGDFSHVQRVEAQVQTTQLPDGLTLEELRALARGGGSNDGTGT